MPNGKSRNWIRFLASLEGFYVTHGQWPDRAYVYLEFIEELKIIMKPADFDRLKGKLKLIPDAEATFKCEDDQGRSYDYGKQGFAKAEAKPSTMEWLAVSEPDHEDLNFINQFGV